LFDPQQLAVARQRLLDVECDLPSEDSTPDAKEQPFPEEVPGGVRLFEGAVRQVLVNAYERNATARAVCIGHYGPVCVACGFNFGSSYGKLAEGFIHVHHIRQLSEIGESYIVDPIADLRPVCPNCHAVIHLGGESRSIEEVRQLLAGRVNV
jgi:5-methylcytosine-specific restriction protein A